MPTHELLLQQVPKILVVDDNEMNREILTRRLVRKGFETSEAEGGSLALEKINAQTFDLVLLDVMMPDIDGITVLKTVREIHNVVDLPIIMVTAKDQSDSVIEALAAGANDYVTKPVDFPVLMARIEAQLARKHAEAALLQSEERYRNLFEKTGDLIFMLTANGEVQYANPAARQKLDLARSQESIHWQDFVHPHYQEPLLALFERLMQEKQSLALETCLITSQGESLLVEGNFNCYYQGQEALGVQAIFRDMTERKRVEQMKDEFVSTVSHELRTPLTAIHGSLRLLTQGIMGSFDADVMALLQVAENNTERLMVLINDILDMSKIEAGKMDFNFQSLSLWSLLKRAMQENQPYADKYQVQFCLAPIEKPDSLRVNADTTRLLQVLANLMSNAAKFSPAQHEVLIQMESLPPWVKVSIQDQGLGIPRQFHDQIFKKFSQVDSSATRQKGGTGLGLSISKAIIEQHQGEIGFESEEGQGSTFYFKLPLEEENEDGSHRT